MLTLLHVNIPSRNHMVLVLTQCLCSLLHHILLQSDPSLPGDGASPDLHPDDAAQLPQDESSGPKAAGQGVVDDIAKKDPERYGSDRASPA